MKAQEKLFYVIQTLCN